jgi:hypothetical protein
MWVVSLKKRNNVLKLMRIKGFVMIIGEKKCYALWGVWPIGG